MHDPKTLIRLNEEAAARAARGTERKPDLAAERAYHRAALSDHPPTGKTLAMWRRALELGIPVINLGLAQ